LSKEETMPTQRASTARVSLAIAVLLITLTSVTSASAGSYYPTGLTGSDISYPLCGTLPAPPVVFGIVGVTAGRAFSQNGCLASEFAWAKLAATLPSLYMNRQYPIGTTASYAMSGHYGNCSQKNKECQASNYGWNAADNAYVYAGTKGATASRWWLDIETANSWSPKTALNDRVIQGALDYFQNQGITAGIYSTKRMWTTIAGNFQPASVESWVAQTTAATAPGYCGTSGPFGTGPLALEQYVSGGQDWDYAC
jgi:hypothetical protein